MIHLRATVPFPVCKCFFLFACSFSFCCLFILFLSSFLYSYVCTSYAVWLFSSLPLIQFVFFSLYLFILFVCFVASIPLVCILLLNFSPVWLLAVFISIHPVCIISSLPFILFACFVASTPLVCILLS